MKKIKEKLIKTSIKDEKWVSRAKTRQANKRWMDISFKIALKILRHLRKHKITQKSVAIVLGCSPQYFSKLLKGRENLTLETISRLEEVLDIQLIEVLVSNDELINDNIKLEVA